MDMIQTPNTPGYAYVHEIKDDQMESFPATWSWKKFFLLGENGAITSSSAWNKNIVNPIIINDQNLEEARDNILEKINFESSIKQRLNILKRDGDLEGISYSRKSENYLIDFFKNHLIKNRPSIFLLENGNFRVLWKNKFGEQIGLQFLDNGDIQYVMFARRTDRVDLARSYGSDTPESINRFVEANRLRNLIYS